MARNVLVDAGFLVALLSHSDSHHKWAATQALSHAPPWHTCDAVLSEAFHLLGARGAPGLSAMLHRRALIAAFNMDNELEPVLKLLQKYPDRIRAAAPRCRAPRPQGSRCLCTVPTCCHRRRRSTGRIRCPETGCLG